MVFKTLVSLSKTATKCSATTPFTPLKFDKKTVHEGRVTRISRRTRRGSWVDGSGNKPQHPFFKPSYIPQLDLIIAENITRDSEDDCHDYWEFFTRPHSSVVTNYVFVYDPSFLSFDHFKQSRDRIPNRKLVNSAKGGFLQTGYLSNVKRHDDCRFKRAFTTMSYNQGMVKDDIIQIKSAGKHDELELQENAAAVPPPPQQEATPQQLSEEPPSLVENLSESSIDSEIQEGTFEHFVKLQTDTIHRYMADKKYNEVFAIYQHLMSNEQTGMLPVSLYADVLKSISMRTGTGETIEERLTLLLDVYSDLLKSGQKPNENVYSIVIHSLLQGSKQSYIDNDSTNGFQFYQVALELITIRKNQVFPKSTYENLIFCMNAYQMMGPFNASEIYHMCLTKCSKTASYFVGMMKLCQYDVKCLHDVYQEYTDACAKDASLRQHKFEVYASFVHGLILSNRADLASEFMDKVVNAKERRMNIAPMLSNYILGFELRKSNELYEKFDSIDWLPDVEVDCLVKLTERALQEHSFKLAMKFWTLAVSRKDFSISLADKNQLNMLLHGVNGEYYTQVCSKFVDSMILLNQRNHVLRLARDVIVKDGLRLQVQTLINTIEYLKSWGVSEHARIIEMLVISQMERWDDPNELLSLVVDFLPSVSDIAASNAFRKACEQFRLVSNNVYGIREVLVKSNDDDNDRIRYLRKIVKAEFEDMNNFYVELPADMKEFKQWL